MVAFLAAVGLLINIINWNLSFQTDNNNVAFRTAANMQGNVLTELVTFLAVVSVILKYYFKNVWMDYRQPLAFVKTLLNEQ